MKFLAAFLVHKLLKVNIAVLTCHSCKYEEGLGQKLMWQIVSELVHRPETVCSLPVRLLGVE